VLTTPTAQLLGLPAALCKLVFDTLFSCLEDYSMDKRGDVGSWVRCAALEGLRDVTLESVKASVGLVWDYSGASEGGGEGGGEEEEIVFPAMADRMKTLVRDVEAKVQSAIDTGSAMDPSYAASADLYLKPFFDPAICRKVLSAILKQLGEKLDNVRDLAGGILAGLLDSGAKVRLPFVSDRGFLEQALSSKTAINWASPTTTFPMMVKAMNMDAYHAGIVEGLCVSVGGLTER
jgi:hypothetical protein